MGSGVGASRTGVACRELGGIAEGALGAWIACCRVESIPSRYAGKAEGLLLIGLVLTGVTHVAGGRSDVAEESLRALLASGGVGDVAVPSGAAVDGVEEVDALVSKSTGGTVGW